MLLRNKKIAIIGAGPVGLTMAKLLQQEGIIVSVYERDKDSQTRITGGPLDLHKDSGQNAMKKAGLLEYYYEMAIPMGRIIADKEAKIIFSKKVLPEDKYNSPEINRNDLKRILLESLETNTVVWDRKFTKLEAKQGKWFIHFENNIIETADFVIGADGGTSKVRNQLTDTAIEYTGTTIIQGDIPKPEIVCPLFYHLCNDSILMSSDINNLFVANPKNGNLLSYSITFQEDKNWQYENELDLHKTDNMISFLLKRFSDWNILYKQLIQSTSSFYMWQTRKMPMNKPWKINRPLPITLIGDAAHVMPPFAGHGVNIGLKDALILSENLIQGKYKIIEDAIRDYEKKMFIYATHAQNETSINEKKLHKKDFILQRFYR